MQSDNAIGVFDSGLGGLSAVKEFMRVLPTEKIIYFGDTGRVPYGTRSRETIKKYAFQDAAFLLEHKVKMIVAACGTVSSVAACGAGGGASRSVHRGRESHCLCSRSQDKKRQDRRFGHFGDYRQPQLQAQT